MSQQNQKQRIIEIISALFIIWFTLWLILLVALPSSSYTLLFFALGLIPLVGWFLVKPRRFLWMLGVLLGTRGVDS